jgi:hypothetical protein
VPQFDEASESYQRVGHTRQKVGQDLQQHAPAQPTLKRMKGTHSEFIFLESTPARMGTSREETPKIIVLMKPTVNACR